MNKHSVPSQHHQLQQGSHQMPHRLSAGDTLPFVSCPLDQLIVESCFSGMINSPSWHVVLHMNAAWKLAYIYMNAVHMTMDRVITWFTLRQSGPAQNGRTQQPSVQAVKRQHQAAAQPQALQRPSGQPRTALAPPPNPRGPHAAAAAANGLSKQTPASRYVAFQQQHCLHACKCSRISGREWACAKLSVAKCRCCGN